ncbi:MAG: hypothetical protein GY822_23380 [Deltaproteobacteria bacterium]|nr:hypothetical protein [Deltaproteobacteria bacterium]
MIKSNPFIRAASSFFCASLFISLAACSPGGTGGTEPQPSVEPDASEPDAQPNYTAALLDEYRAVLPSHDVLDAPEPRSSVNAQIGNAATYPGLAAPQIMAVNQTLTSIIDTLGDITALEPTLYNSETKEFLWGPFDDDDSPMVDDKVLVYIQDAPEGADFDFQYAFIRYKGNDVADWTPVIWGGVNPDADEPDTYGNGVLLYDLEANADFVIANNPAAVREDLHQGRFAIAYMRQPDDNNANTDVTAVISVFRGFHGPGEPAVDFEQLFGRVENFDDGNTFEFANIETEHNIHEPEASDVTEDVSVRLAFFNRGIGRAEALVFGGDLTTATGESSIAAVECWDETLARTFFTLDAEGEITGGTETISIEAEGDSASCGHFETSLDDLDIPSLDSIDSDLLDALSDVAENGLAE